MGLATEGLFGGQARTARRDTGIRDIEKDLDDVIASLFDRANAMVAKVRPIAYPRVLRLRVSQSTPAVVLTLLSQPFIVCLMNEDSYVIRPTFQVLWLI